MEEPVRTKFLDKTLIQTASSVNIEKYEENQLISHIITEVQKSSRHETGLAVRVICFPLT